jgi:hypothetical protein
VTSCHGATVTVVQVHLSSLSLTQQSAILSRVAPKSMTKYNFDSGKGSWAKGAKIARPPERNPYARTIFDLDLEFIRFKICRNVHGEIPGFPVGSRFANRMECSEAGVHAPLRAGIHGNQNDGAFSVVLYVFSSLYVWTCSPV